MRRAIWSNLLYGTGGSTGGGTKGGDGGEEIIKALGVTESGAIAAYKEVELGGDSVEGSTGKGNTVTSSHIERNGSHRNNNNNNSSSIGSQVGTTTDTSKHVDPSTFPSAGTSIGAGIGEGIGAGAGAGAVQGNTAGSRSGGVGRGGGSISRGILQLSSDVDVAAISCKYELSGGFIKNAVLSALLSAISRCTLDQTPVLTQVV